jgi:hypothetical protein
MAIFFFFFFFSVVAPLLFLYLQWIPKDKTPSFLVQQQRSLKVLESQQ